MLPARLPEELSTAREGLVLMRSLPSTWSMVKNSLVRLTGALQVAPLSVERTKPTFWPKKDGNRRQAT